MLPPELSALTSLIASSVDEPWRNQDELLRQFPYGLAPFTRANLLAYTFLGSLEVFVQPLAGTYGLSNVLFPASIIAAGIAGAISLRRSNQANEVPRLLLITLGLRVRLRCSTLALAEASPSTCLRRPLSRVGSRLGCCLLAL